MPRLVMRPDLEPLVIALRDAWKAWTSSPPSPEALRVAGEAMNAARTALFDAVDGLPAAAPTARPRYFKATDGGMTYTIVARDHEHAKQVLLDAKQGFEGDDGEYVPCDAAAVRWAELSAAEAAVVRVTDDERGSKHALTTYEPGNWFSSEF